MFTSHLFTCANLSALCFSLLSFFFFFNDTPTTEIYTLSLHDALPISPARAFDPARPLRPARSRQVRPGDSAAYCAGDRKSTRLNSSHPSISYAVFCLKKKKKKKSQLITTLKHNQALTYINTSQQEDK